MLGMAGAGAAFLLFQIYVCWEAENAWRGEEPELPPITNGRYR